MTSNLGSEYLMKSAILHTKGELDATVKEMVMGKVKQHFRPEFLNRLDDIVIFKPLSHKQLKGIIHIQIGHLLKRLESQDIKLEIHDNAAEVILKQAYDVRIVKASLSYLYLCLTLSLSLCLCMYTCSYMCVSYAVSGNT